ncbi:hypothetical protein A8F94_01505 [Bacillus sp. FJAT-27225]|uniref:HAAS signaling domain-containing protein n=1 Tax=Bacillus sp. FJAT-27225 TaxID=1743144 RepID=UPI00080C2F1A|nr:hypothetical protein [Bacillus sp. FJAT-27225]OCA90586.1 hypothetical protein A8F94_01505 [Bacillus sp. FJAT-27225]
MEQVNSERQGNGADFKRLKSEFLKELSLHLGSIDEKESILTDYDAHLDDMLIEMMDVSVAEAKDAIYIRLGTPGEIAALWRDEVNVTPSNMKWLFVLLNVFLFAGGAGLTAAHNVLEWGWIRTIWNYVISIPIIISFIYLFFWALLGYEIGRSFGHKGRSLVRKTFLLALVPNLIMMVLTVFGIIPHKWFDPLLTNQFIAACIGFTAMLYPVSILGYHWGKRASV